MNGKPVGLLGLGSYLPERVMTNEDWSQYVDTSDEWIVSRTGIRERRIAAEDETTVSLGLVAARRALEDAATSVEEIDEIIVATDTPEVSIPDTAPYLQHRLGAREIPTYDLAKSGCAGFLQAMDVARSRILTGHGKVLVVGIEILSRIVDWSDRNTCVLFGDAAGAAVLSRAPTSSSNGAGFGEILAATAGTDGSQTDILTIEAGGTRVPFSTEVAAEGRHKRLVMHGREVFKEAVRRMGQASREALEQAGIEMSDVALVIPHQANLRILNAVARSMDLPDEKLFVNVDRYGNTGSASVPLGLCQARKEGRIRPGDTVLLTTFGAGFHWAAMVVRF